MLLPSAKSTGVLIDRALEKIPKFNKRVIKIKGCLYLRRGLKFIEGRKEQKQAVIKYKTEMYTAVRYFPMKIERK